MNNTKLITSNLLLQIDVYAVFYNSNMPANYVKEISTD